jgi:hypothetical protein
MAKAVPIAGRYLIVAAAPKYSNILVTIVCITSKSDVEILRADASHCMHFILERSSTRSGAAQGTRFANLSHHLCTFFHLQRKGRNLTHHKKIN